MKFLDYFRIAFKNITRQKARSILTIIAIVVGSLSVIIMLSLVFSARRVMINQLESIGGFTLLTVSGGSNMEGSASLFDVNNGGPDNDTKKLDDSTINTLKSLDHVSAITPVANIWAKAMKIEGSEKRTWPNILAYDVDSNVFDMPIVAGRGLKKDDMDKVVVGVDVIKSLGYEDKPKDVIGKNLILILDGYNTPDWGPAPEKPPMNADKDWWDQQSKKSKEIKVEIIGVTSGAMDSRQSFITMGWARKMQTQVRWEFDETARKAAEEARRNSNNYNNDNFNDYSFQRLVKEDMITKNGYSGIMIKADNTNNVASLAKKIKDLGYGVTTAEEILKEIQKIFTMLGILAGVIGGISLFVAAIGIINTMIMATYERTREIGVMRACGATKATIRKLFTFEASLLGFFGGIFGLILSFGLAKIGNIVATKIATSESLPIENFITFPIWLTVGVIAFTTLIGLLAGLYPAAKAAKLNPVEALRYE